MNADEAINVLDVVATVNFILEGTLGMSTQDDAIRATLVTKGDALTINADGYIGGVQMTLSHGLDFSIELTDKTLHGVADYRTNGTETVLVIVNPTSDELFVANGDYDITSMIVANSMDAIDVTVAPKSLALSAAYPNPFNPRTSVNLSLPSEGYASV